MTATAPLRPIRLADYRPPAYLVEKLELDFQLDRETTVVASRARYRADRKAPAGTPLRLDGRRLELDTILLDGQPLPADRFERDDEGLTLHDPPATFELTVTTRIHPAANTSLEGLYASGGKLCTQCEAHGFSRITYFPDRPDILTRITTRITACRKTYPLLLSNGNLVDRGELGSGRHYAVWEDPFKKPVYLFALVAGDLATVEDEFVTASGRRVRIHFHVEEPFINQCGHAVNALKKAMAWDEREYGREYDLDLYQVVAVGDFNFGAMENKGLNIFNSRYVLAEAETATDSDFEAIESVIAHEYLHNWTGNRITCRDWFQLSLKEGLTVFRDQQYGAWAYPGGGRRIREVRRLRSFQFPEDRGPLAHPVQPKEYVEINNFYTTTIYEKGAEVIRMLHTLLGREKFRRGMDIYFARHDGQAVTIEDLLAAMSEASSIDLEQFHRWYDQAGTPQLKVTRQWEPETGTFRLTVGQQTPLTPGQPEKRPLHIPLATALLDDQGREITAAILELTEASQTFSFSNLAPAAAPIPSLLRGFSAPVELSCDYSLSELAFLLAHDRDPFCRWEAGQKLALKAIFERMADNPPQPEEAARLLSQSFGRLLTRPWDDNAADGVAELLLLPDEIYLGEQCESIAPEAIHQARESLRRDLAAAWKKELALFYERYRDSSPWRPEPAAMARRRLKNIALDYLAAAPEKETALTLCRRQYQAADNLTDRLAALGPLLNLSDAAKAAEIPEMADFFARGEKFPLLRDRWFSLQAAADRSDTVERVVQLTRHPEFIRTNPNRVRALLGTFALANPAAFHRADGAGYRLLGGEIAALDRLNPQVAARLAGPLSRWSRYAEPHRTLMRTELEKLAARPGLSRDLEEIVTKSLTDTKPG
jgi:aminopeptidase N